MLAVGDDLPKVRVEDDKGRTVELASLVGAPLVLFFYPRADTPGCTTEASQFRDAFPEFERKGVVIVGVSRDSVGAQAKFKAKYDLPYCLLADVDSAICDAFGVIVEKNMYGRKSMGIVRSTFLVDANGKVARVWPKVSINGHVDEVLRSV